MSRLLVPPFLLALAASCVIGGKNEQFHDDAIGSVCLRTDGQIDVNFEVLLAGYCMIELDTQCEATLDRDGVLQVTGKTMWRENGVFCSNIEAWNPQATCAPPTAWDGLEIEVHGLVSAVVACPYSNN